MNEMDELSPQLMGERYCIMSFCPFFNSPPRIDIEKDMMQKEPKLMEWICPHHA
jgi:hypothetical protein